jgi:hypothetical protein
VGVTKWVRWVMYQSSAKDKAKEGMH